MDTMQCIYTRRSIRKYLDIPLEGEILGRIIEAGTKAPTSGNIQEFRFVVITDETKRKALSQACLQQYWMEKAPVHVVACAEIKRPKQFYGIRGERLYTIQNVAAACQNILLAAHNYGVGSCWVGAFDEGAVKSIAGIPDYARPHAIITLGYPDEVVPSPAKYKIEHMYYLQRYGNRIKNVNVVLLQFSPVLAEGVKGVKDYVDKKATSAYDKVKHHLKKLHKKLKGEE